MLNKYERIKKLASELVSCEKKSKQYALNPPDINCGRAQRTTYNARWSRIAEQRELIKLTLKRLINEL